MVYEAASDTVILFGGTVRGDPDYTALGDTVIYDPAAAVWTDLDPAFAPPARSDHAMSYDEDDGQVILFGGCGTGDNCFGDTWGYDPLTFSWLDLEPLGETPSPRQCATLVYDPGSGASLLFGGTEYFDQFNDTWAYDRATNAWVVIDKASPS